MKFMMVPEQCQQNRSIGISRALLGLAMTGVGLVSAGCGHQNSSFSMLPASQSFQQAQATVNNKIDILWVVDNSGSMNPLQQNLVSNFGTFINNFQAKGFDYNMTFTTTDAYLSETNFDNNPKLAAIRDGAGSTHSGYFFITPWIPNIVQNFVTNATQGATGSGDERAFQSMFDALSSPLNMGMLRPSAFFAIVILSDEDDFTDPNRPEGSWQMPGGIPDHDYNNPNLPTVDSVVAQLDKLTSSTSANRRYNVSAITVMDSTCQQSHLPSSPTTVVGQRYMDLANQTGGIVGSICDASYANSLNFIQQRIVELTTQFALATAPDPASIVVTVNNAVVPQDATNGWTYDATTNAITFHGTAVPPASAAINVQFNPLTLK